MDTDEHSIELSAIQSVAGPSEFTKRFDDDKREQIYVAEG